MSFGFHGFHQTETPAMLSPGYSIKVELVAQVLGPIAAELAYGEGLQAHAWAAEMRLDSVG